MWALYLRYYTTEGTHDEHFGQTFATLEDAKDEVTGTLLLRPTRSLRPNSAIGTPCPRKILTKRKYPSLRAPALAERLGLPR
jgi:hypothetical protein